MYQSSNRSLEEFQCEFNQTNINLNKKNMLESDQRLKLMTAQDNLFRVATEKLRITNTNTLEDIFDRITEQ